MPREPSGDKSRLNPFALALQMYLEREHIDVAELAKKIERGYRDAGKKPVVRQLVYKWVNGISRPKWHNEELVTRILKIPGLQVEAVAGTSYMRRVPVIDQADRRGGTVTPLRPAKTETYEISADLAAETIALRLRGDSMEPTFFDGEIVLIDPTQKPENTECVLAELPSGEWIFRQYHHRGYISEGEVFDLMPFNPEYPTLTIKPGEGRILGPMSEHHKRSARFRKRATR